MNKVLRESLASGWLTVEVSTDDLREQEAVHVLLALLDKDNTG